MVQNFIHDIENTRLVAKVKRSNLASRRIFEKLGFRVSETTSDLLIFTKDQGVTLAAASASRYTQPPPRS